MDIKTKAGTGFRDDYDFYPTKQKDVYKFLNHVFPLYPSDKVLDVGCGYGVWGETYKKIMNENNYESGKITGVDIQDFPTNSDYDNWFTNYDYLSENNIEKLGMFDLIIGNPPFKCIQEFIELSYDLLESHGEMLFLTRMGFLGSQKRYGFFNRIKPARVFVLSKRLGFIPDKNTTDRYEYILLYYNKNYSGLTELSWLL